METWGGQDSSQLAEKKIGATSRNPVKYFVVLVGPTPSTPAGNSSSISPSRDKPRQMFPAVGNPSHGPSRAMLDKAVGRRRFMKFAGFWEERVQQLNLPAGQRNQRADESGATRFMVIQKMPSN